VDAAERQRRVIDPLPRYLRGVTTWLSVAAALTAIVALGFERGVMLLFIACGLAWPAYLLAFRYVASRRPVVVESGQLVQRTASGRIVGSIDLAAPFETRCLHDEGEWTLYRVKQGHWVVRIAVPLNADSQIVRETLRLPWPPPAANPFRYLAAVVAFGLAAASVAAAQSPPIDVSERKMFQEGVVDQ
jgi:hypothetical protein